MAAKRSPQKNRAYAQAWRDKNPERSRELHRQDYARHAAQNVEKARARRRAAGAQPFAPANPLNRMLGDAKKRARQKDIPFEITLADFPGGIPAVCPVLGIPLESQIRKGTPKDCSPSIDRLQPALGYVSGNVRIISKRANQIKNNGTAAEHRAIADYMDKNRH